MADARSAILEAVAAATEAVRDADPAAAHAALERGYRQRGTRSPSERVETLVERLREDDVRVVRTSVPRLAVTIAAELRRAGARRVVVPNGVPDTWLDEREGFERVPEATDAHALDAAHAALTGCALAIADTGTLILDGGEAQGRRAVSLVPDVHVCVVREDQVVDVLPEGVAGVTEAARSGVPITMVTGPSATSDIELERVAGVHGPRTLVAVVVAG